MAVIIRNGVVATENSISRCDIKIENGIFSDIAERIIPQSTDEIVDADGVYVLPGGIDAHVHLEQSAMGAVNSDDWYTGTKAAAMGGTTTVISFIIPETDDVKQNFAKWYENASSKSAIDFGAHYNLPGSHDRFIDQLHILTELGIPSVQFFLAGNGTKNISDYDLLCFFDRFRDSNLMAMVNAENADFFKRNLLKANQQGKSEIETIKYIHSRWARIEAVSRLCKIAAECQYDSLYFAHLNLSEEIEILRWHKNNGLKAVGETCLQYLCFTENVYKDSHPEKWICTPAFGENRDIDALWHALMDDTVDFLSSDHCPYLLNGAEEFLYEGTKYHLPGKEVGHGDYRKTPLGLPGVGDRIPVFWTEGVVKHHLPIRKFVDLVAANPAKVFGLYPQKGCIRKGSDADLVLFSPKLQVSYGRDCSYHRSDYNVYEGFELTGFPVSVMQRGSWLVKNREWTGKKGAGVFIPRENPL